MEQISYEQIYTPECAKFEICLENLEEKEVKVGQVKVENNIVKNRTLKLFKKAELNAKYFEELQTVRLVRSQTNFRNYGVF